METTVLKLTGFAIFTIASALLTFAIINTINLI